MSRAGELREKDIARRVRRAKGESLTARNDAVTTEKERANEGNCTQNSRIGSSRTKMFLSPPTKLYGTLESTPWSRE